MFDVGAGHGSRGVFLAPLQGKEAFAFNEKSQNYDNRG